jgi:mycothiol synthase
MALPQGFRFRPARDEDAPAVSAFENDECEALIGVRVSTVERLLQDWTAPSVDRERDVAVIEAPDGELCGSLYVASEPPYTSIFTLGVVALPYHGRGLGAAIVEENERRAQRFVELADPDRQVVIHTGALAEEPRVGALLVAHGYREVRRFQLMRVEFDGEPAPPELPDGIELRAIRLEQDTRVLYEAHLEAFADHWGEGEETYDDFVHNHFAQPSFDPSLWTLAWHGGELAGYAGGLAEAVEDPSRGYVSVLGVRRAFRRLGVGEALLRHTFGLLHPLGKRGCDLHVDADSLTGATRLYERVGMTQHPRFATWEKEIRRARAAQ